MAYVDPEQALSPRKAVRNIRPVFNKVPVQESWSGVELDWKGESRVGIRWNGDEGGKDNPQSHGYPTWFIVPRELERAVLDEARRLLEGQQ